MKKDELINFISGQAGLTKKSAGEALAAMLEGIAVSLEKGEDIALIGFGSFKVVERSAREGRNPQTGEKIQIPASKGVKFTSGKQLKERVQ